MLIMFSRSYNEIDGVPAAVNPMLYDALDDWRFDGLVIADDLCELTDAGGQLRANKVRHQEPYYPTPSCRRPG